MFVSCTSLQKVYENLSKIVFSATRFLSESASAKLRREFGLNKKSSRFFHKKVDFFSNLHNNAFILSVEDCKMSSYFYFVKFFYGCDYVATKGTFFIQMIGEYINGSDAHTRDDLREHYTLPHYLK